MTNTKSQTANPFPEIPEPTFQEMFDWIERIVLKAYPKGPSPDDNDMSLALVRFITLHKDVASHKATTRLKPLDDGTFRLYLEVGHQGFTVGYDGNKEEAMFMQDMLVKALTSAGVQWQM